MSFFSGDDASKCHAYAESTAADIQSAGIADSVVLNFKRGEDEIHFMPDRDKLMDNGIRVQSLASTLRWLLFGPVADKWLNENGEYDIRIAGKSLRSAHFSAIENIHVPVRNTSVLISSLGAIEKENEVAKLYRKDGKRAAFFTVEMSGYSTDKALFLLSQILDSQKMDKGYAFSINHSLLTLSEKYRRLMAVLFLSVLGIFILLTALTENGRKSLRIISIIPVSLVLPLALRLISRTPLELGDIVGMVVLSGLTVNNAIYITESRKQVVMFKIREKMRSICVTSLTTVSGAVPLLILGQDSFSKCLAFFMLFGIINSFLASLVLFPAVLKR